MSVIECDERSAILLREQKRIGGEIREGKLYPIAPLLTALLPLEPTADLQRRWHVVCTQPQQEKTVVDELEKMKLDAYRPVEPKRVRVNAVKHRTVLRSMLPGYVFAGFDAAYDEWQVISSMRGVIRVIMIAMRPVPVAQAVIDYIKLRELQRSAERCFKRPPITLAIGTLVRVIEPFCFAGLFGFIGELNHQHGQLCVEIEIFGRKTPVWLTQDQVETV